jgi:hypothetical protein
MNVIQKSYNAKRAELFGKKLTGTDRLILMRSSIWTHTEFQFSERYNNISFSFTMADNAKCGRFKQIEYSHQAERWDDVIIPMTDEQEDKAYAEAQRLKGVPYDLVGLLSHATPLKLIMPHKKNMWCTEGVNHLLVAGRPDYLAWLKEHKFPLEMTPDVGYMLASYYFNH